MVKFRIWPLGLLLLSLTIGTVLAKPESWRDRATAAIMAGDYRTALDFYRKWTAADPTDAVSLYNLACCYTLLDSVDAGMRTLELAADAGWSDSLHTSLDDDLKKLHGRPAFIALLERIARNARLASGGYTSHTCAQIREGKYVVVLPDEYDPNGRYPLVVLLHGHGSSPEEFASVAALIDPHDYIYVVPQGSYTAAGTEGKGYSHFRELEDFSEDTASIDKAVAWVLAVVNDARARYPVADSTFMMVGFSQGAALAHLVAARHPERVTAYVAHGGYLVAHEFSGEQLKRESELGVRILITHDKEDPSVEFAEAVYATGMFQHFGAKVEIKPLEQVGHKFTAEVGRLAAEWLAGK
jgi:predicted esterase